MFVHCGVLSVGVRKKLGLPSPFDLRLGDPLAVAALALRFPSVPVIIPHFGAGLLPRSADGRGSVSEHPPRHVELEQLDEVPSRPDARGRLPQALAVVGPDRLLFGTDSSFFPRGWQKPVYDAQVAALDAIGVDASTTARRFFGGNFERLFPVEADTSKTRRPQLFAREQHDGEITSLDDRLVADACCDLVLACALPPLTACQPRVEPATSS